jgi:GAF domain-containing protein
MSYLYYLTFAINFLGLVLALWLGIYLVTRNARYLIAWLTALTLWSMTGLFLNVILAINPPPIARYQPFWLRFMFPFWPAVALQGSPNNWLLSWVISPAVAFWHNATILMRPGRLTAWRWTRILVGYLIAFFAIIIQVDAPILFVVPNSNPLFLNSLHAGSWYAIFAVALLILTWASVINLFRSAYDTPAVLPHKQFILLAIATLIAGLIGPVSIAGSVLGWPIPMVIMSLLEAIPVGIIGYSVARYSAVAAGRTIQRDFVYNLLLMTGVVTLYLLTCGFLVGAYSAPRIIMVFVPVLAVVTHSLMAIAYRLLDWLFYRRETRQLRSNLRTLVRLAGEGESLEGNLALALESLCTPVLATYGLILTIDGNPAHQVAAYHWRKDSVELPPEALAADDYIHLAPGHFPVPLEEAALLVPLYGEAEQVGALILGRPVNGIRYANEEVERLMNMADRIGDAIYFSKQKRNYISQIAKLAQVPQPAATLERKLPVPVEIVESALRNMYNYAYLGGSPLAELKLVCDRLSQGDVTSLDRGRIVHEILLEGVNKLRPGASTSRDPPPREWYPYLILRDAYLEELSNRDIMQHLYISEGTFNRTRRAAVRSVARALGEMEAASN